MRVYIPVDCKEQFSHKVELMVAKFEKKPMVTYSEPKVIMLRTTVVWEDGVILEKAAVNAIEVEIEDVEVGGWELVASVDYQLGSMFIVDEAMFKHIPAGYGLGYMKCDICGKVHASRKEAHILYNKESGEWMQVGTSCVNKLFSQGKYLAKFCYDLYSVVKMFDGCGMEGLGSWSPSQKYVFQAVSTMDALKAVLAYQVEYGDVWEKTSYVEGAYGRRTKIDGTNDKVRDYYFKGEYEDKDCTELYAKILAYVSAFGDESEFKVSVKKAFVNEFINACDMFRVWFGLKMYRDSLVDFEGDVERAGIGEGKKVAVKAKLMGCERHEGFYGVVYTLKFKDENTGFVFVKDCSSRSAADKFCKDDVYTFSAAVKYIDRRRQRIVLGGRLSK